MVVFRAWARRMEALPAATPRWPFAGVPLCYNQPLSFSRLRSELPVNGMINKITKASFAGLELPRLLNEVKYSNIRGEQPF